MINRIELTLSNRGYCFKCKRKMKLAEVRGVDDFNRFFCIKCINFKEMIKEIKNIEKEFKVLNKLTQKQREERLFKRKILRKLR